MEFYKGENLSYGQLFQCFASVTIRSCVQYKREFNSYLHSLDVTELLFLFQKNRDIQKYTCKVLVEKVYHNTTQCEKILKKLSLSDKCEFLSRLAVRQMKVKRESVSDTINELLKLKSPGETAILLYNILNKSKNRRKNFTFLTNYNLLSILWNIECNYIIEIFDFFKNTEVNIYQEFIDCDLEVSAGSSRFFFRFLSMIAAKFFNYNVLILLGSELKNPTILKWYSEYTSQV